MDKEQAKLLISVLIGLFYICPIIYRCFKKRNVKSSATRSHSTTSRSANPVIKPAGRQMFTNDSNNTPALPGEKLPPISIEKPERAPEKQDNNARYNAENAAGRTRREQLKNYIIWSEILARRI